MRRMRGLLKFVFSLIVLALIVLAAGWFWAGRMDGPMIEIRQPGKFIGQSGTIEMVVQAPGGKFSRVDFGLEQGGKTYPVFEVNSDAPGGGAGKDPADRLIVMRPIGKQAIADLKSGPARIVVHAGAPTAADTAG